MTRGENVIGVAVVVDGSRYAAPVVTTPLFQIDDRAKPSPSLARFALGPVSLVVAFALYYGGHASQLVTMVIVGVGLIAFQWASVLANASRDAYDRAAVLMQSKGRGGSLRARLDAALPFLLFGTTAEKAARRGAVLSGEGKYELAAKSWAEAVAGYPGGKVPRAVALGFASAAFEAGWNRDAARVYRSLFETDPELPRVRTRLAHALARLGEDLDEAGELLTVEEKVEEKKGRADVELAVARAAWLGARRKPKSARTKLDGQVGIPGYLDGEVAALREKKGSSRPPAAEAAPVKKSRSGTP